MRRQAAIAGWVAFLAGSALLAWWLTSARELGAFDWDNAAHIWAVDAHHASGTFTAGYTAHLALIPLYSLAARLAYLVGGTTFDAVRALHALYVAAGAAALAATLRRHGLRGGRLYLACALWVTSADVVFLVRTVEDDCGSLALQSLVVCLVAADRGSARRALAAGAVLATAALLSYQNVVWLPFIVAGTLTWPARSIAARLLRPAAALAGFAAVVLAWGGWLVLADRGASWSGYLHTLVATPNAKLMAVPNQWHALFDYASKYLPPMLLPSSIAEPISRSPAAAGVLTAVALAALAFGLLWPWRRGPARVSPHGRVVTLLCLAAVTCTLPSALKNEGSLYERLLQLPLIFAVLVGLWLARTASSTRRSRRWLPPVAVGLWVAVQLVDIARIPPYSSWLGRFELVRDEHPGAAAYVLAESELHPNGHDKLLSARLTGMRVLSPAGASARWLLAPAGAIRLDAWRRAPIAGAWLSPAARALAGQP